MLPVQPYLSRIKGVIYHCLQLFWSKVGYAHLLNQRKLLLVLTMLNVSLLYNFICKNRGIQAIYQTIWQKLSVFIVFFLQIRIYFNFGG